MTKFKVGDYVVGNSRAGDRYAFTGEGWTGQVTRLRPNSCYDIEVMGADGKYFVDDQYFDLIGNATEPIYDLDKLHPGDYIVAKRDTDPSLGKRISAGTILKTTSANKFFMPNSCVDKKDLRWNIYVNIPKDGDEKQWVHSEDFHKIITLSEEDMPFKLKDSKKEDCSMAKFKIGDMVSAIDTFNRNGRTIEKYVKYKVVCAEDADGDIRIELPDGTWWWVSGRKMRLVSSGSVYTGTDVMLKIKDVIYSNPATIVFWDDGSKTVVRCGKDETFDPEKGLAMAISKRVLGSNYAWHGRFNKWLPKNRAEKNSKKKGENKKDE